MSKKISLRKNVLGMILATVFVMMLQVLILPQKASASSWPSVSTSKYIKCYTISTGNNTTAYSSTNLKTKKGTIYGSDELWILKITDKYAYVSYPISGGRKKAYIPTKVITSNNQSAHTKTTSRAKITTYRRAGSKEYGYISKGDWVIRVATSGKYTQVIYPTGSTMKMGWISTSNYDNYVAAQKTTTAKKSTASAPKASTAKPAATSSASAVQNKIYSLAMASDGNLGKTYQKWAGIDYSLAWCAAYATYICNHAMTACGRTSSQALAIVPKLASASKLAEWYNKKNRYYSFAAWTSGYTGIKMKKNSSISAYTPKVGDICAISNDGNDENGPEHAGLLIKVSSKELVLAEGNTKRNRNQTTNETRTVNMHTYTKKGSYWQRTDDSNSKIIGFCNPAY